MKPARIIAASAGALVALVIILWAGGWLAPSSGEPEARPGPDPLAPPPHRQRVEVRPRTAWYEAVGTVRSRVEATVASQITGRVIEITARAGDRVSRGDLLVRLESREYRARREQARSALAGAEAERDRARAALERTRRLFTDKAATKEQLEESQARSAQAEAAAAAAREKVEEALAYLEYTKIESPMDGIVTDRKADPGDLAYPGGALLVIQDPDELQLEANVREGLIARVERLRSEKAELDASIAALGETVRGAITEIVPAADPVSRSFLVKAPLPATEGLFPGMFGKLRIPLQQRPCVVVPAAAVTRVGQIATVVVQSGSGWARRFVTVGAELDDGLEILSGLAAGETIGWR